MRNILKSNLSASAAAAFLFLLFCAGCSDSGSASNQNGDLDLIEAEKEYAETDALEDGCESFEETDAEIVEEECEEERDDFVEEAALEEESVEEETGAEETAFNEETEEDGEEDEKGESEYPEEPAENETETVEPETEQFVQPPLYDAEMVRDPVTAQCNFTNHRTTIKNLVALDVWNLTYYSWESIDGELKPIKISAFAAKPSLLSGTMPGVVQAHGLGGYAKEENATGPASLLNAFVIAFTGPGGGDAEKPETVSEGRPAFFGGGMRMFDTIPDVRGSWFWGHATAALRAVTCLETRSEVDKTKIGMTGFSAGGVITLLSASLDDRIKVGVPLSGVLSWNVAVEAPNAWQHMLLTKAGLTTESERWKRLIEYLIDPRAHLAATNAKLMIINGSSDEFFPLTAHNDTYNAVANKDKMTAVAANFDHGCYKVTGVENASDIEERAKKASEGGQRFWFKHWFGTDSKYSYMPTQPQIAIQAAGNGSLILAAVDGGGSGYEVKKVSAWFSNDRGRIFAGIELEKNNGVWNKLVAASLAPETIYYVEVIYKTAAPLSSDEFILTSTPFVPEGTIPNIRSDENCWTE